jgi:hypothetical protein
MATLDPGPPYLSTTEVAKAVGVSFAHLHSLIRRGLLAPPAVVVGKTFCWSADDVRRARKAALSEFRKSAAEFRARGRAILAPEPLDLSDPKYRKRK